MKQIVRPMIVALLLVMAWMVWQKPAPAVDRAAIRAKIPEITQAESADTAAQWRVVTRDVVSAAGANTLEYRLKQLGLEPIRFQITEEVTLHAFDDATLFEDRRLAVKAVETWRQLGIESTLIKADNGIWLVGLGRYYQDEHAEAAQIELQKTGREFRYQHRLVPVPTWRFTFPAMHKTEAEKLWNQLSKTGLMMPVLLPENQFEQLYGKAVTQ